MENEYKEYVNLDGEVRDTPPEKLAALYQKLLKQQEEMRKNFDSQIAQAKVRAETICKLKQNRIAQLGRTLEKHVDIPVLTIPKYYPIY